MIVSSQLESKECRLSFLTPTFKKSELSKTVDLEFIVDHPCDVTLLCFCFFVEYLSFRKSPLDIFIKPLAIFEFNVSRSPTTVPAIELESKSA